MPLPALFVQSNSSLEASVVRNLRSNRGRHAREREQYDADERAVAQTDKRRHVDGSEEPPQFLQAQDGRRAFF